MNIRPKILLAMGVPAAVTVIVGIVAFTALNQGLSTQVEVSRSDQVIAETNVLLTAVVDAETGLRGYIITSKPSFLVPYTAGNRAVLETATVLRKLLHRMPAQLSGVQQIVALHQQWLRKAAEPEIHAAQTGGVAAAARLVADNTGKHLVDQQRALISTIIAAEQQLRDRRDASSNSAARRARITLIAGVGFAVLIGVLIGLLLSKRMSDDAGAVTRAAKSLVDGDTEVRAEVRGHDELSELAQAFNAMADQLLAASDAERQLREGLQRAVAEYSRFATRVASGDLTASVAVNGAEDLQLLSENLNAMVAGLAEISGRVRGSVQEMRSATSEILAAVSQHTASANEQSAAINETTATVEQVRAASEQAAEKANEVAERAETSSRVSDQGTQAVETIARAMQEIRQRVDAITRDILLLSDQTQQIGEITATVSDLADQSNILALNASIEAAKAGEHGKGFAVVATEVRNLAEQSKAATTQVRRILGDIQHATSAAVLATEQGTKVVEQGLELSSQAGEQFLSLAQTIREGSDTARQIAASAQQQKAGMDQIAQAMKEINESTLQFLAGAKQTQQAAEDLNELSRQLDAVSNRYQL